jgi:DNA-directed RNA polymerase specialized sigma24 family protein
VNPLTCRAAVHAASDQLAGLLSDAERSALEDHLAGCDSCSCLMDQLRSTVAVLGSRPEAQVPDSLRAMVAQTDSDRAKALTAQLPHLYALASALDANAADDLVQETLTAALADPDTDTTGHGLAAALERLAAERRPVVESPAAPTAGSDPDADAAELYYPDFYTDGPMPARRLTRPWLGARRGCCVLTTISSRPRPTAPWTQRSAELDPIDVGLVTLVDINGAPFSRAVLELDLPSGEARYRLARARFAVRAALDRYLRS